jgi:hypothetical protein
MIMRLSYVLLVVVLAGCGGASGDGQANRPDTLTRRQRDSAIGASGLPGAQGVRGAIEAQDSAAARNRRLDSIARERP